MRKTFYEFLMTKRNPSSPDSVAEFANNASMDQSFPKQETDFETLSKYLEENASYLPTMTIFDEAFQQYRESL
ncbi:YozE family protein [Lentilactobacillus sp. Marseille-Q4993]|uniref:YozE family protein n=1 Tax=Lentilactobacillus sp. Marseille-Q4993 TaxID=3039492 RepID=UPI0024BC93A0|nr:YozE family protein [Lentilactobacillus sp. Marseille-Q4993]